MPALRPGGTSGVIDVGCDLIAVLLDGHLRYDFNRPDDPSAGLPEPRQSPRADDIRGVRGFGPTRSSAVAEIAHRRYSGYDYNAVPRVARGNRA